MRSSRLVMSYTGPLNGELITACLQLVHARLELSPLSVKRKKNIVNILIECLQNMQYHHAQNLLTEADLNECCVLMFLNKNSVLLECGNYVSVNQANQFSTRLRELNEMPAEDLHRRYLDTLDSGALSDQGGAGLGIMRMIKEAGHPITYSQEPVNNQCTFFWLHIKVPLAEKDYAMAESVAS